MSQLILPGNTAPGDVRAGKLFCAGLYYNAQGTLVDRTGTAVVLTPGASDVVIPAGIYGGVSGDGKVAAVTFNPAKLLNDTTIAGTTGAMPENGAIGGTITTQGGTLSVPAGHTSGGTVTANITGLVASVITTPNVVGGVTGTAIPFLPSGIWNAGDTQLASDPNAVGAYNSVMTKIKEWQIKASGTFRIKFSITNWDNTTNTSHFQIYKNGVAYGTLRTLLTNTTNANSISAPGIAYSEDLSFSANDLIQVWGNSSNSGSCGYLKSFSICFLITDVSSVAVKNL